MSVEIELDKLYVLEWNEEQGQFHHESLLSRITFNESRWDRPYWAVLGVFQESRIVAMYAEIDKLPGSGFGMTRRARRQFDPTSPNLLAHGTEAVQP